MKTPRIFVGDVLLYFNNGQPALPCIVNQVHDENIVSCNVFFQMGVSYRSGLRLLRTEDGVPIAGSEYVTFNEKAIAMERQYPLSPDCW